ncbi:MAG: tetratricopeptide repeat protein [Desulfobacterales bacterium]|jgi:tetratricopeptide (TPR) repeat protein|nr:tetratricopeptide repeat protein [Desulfobacterales bacterium]MDD3950590.1 tetratricopeptide repeat protein [Desulfobacterales bacterium]
MGLKKDIEAGITAIHYGLFEQAVECLSRAIKTGKADDEAYYFRGMAHSAIGDMDRAIQDYTRALEIRPGVTEIHFLRAVCWENKGDCEKAIADAQAALDLDPEDEACQCYIEQIRARLV